MKKAESISIQGNLFLLFSVFQYVYETHLKPRIQQPVPKPFSFFSDHKLVSTSLSHVGLVCMDQALCFLDKLHHDFSKHL